MKGMIIANGTLVLPGGILTLGSLLIQGSKITAIVKGRSDIPDTSDHLVIDAENRFVSPGFIDIHVHGGGRREVNEGDPEAVKVMCDVHARHGTTAILPTVMAAPVKDMIKAIESVRQAYHLSQNADRTGAAILGVHLEGPYFAASQRGAQSPASIKAPDPDEYLPMLDTWDGIRMMGLAPELEGSERLARELVRRGITASIAHSDADFDQVVKAVGWGCSDITHIYSGCSTVHRRNAFRYAGVVEAGLLLDELTVQMIADGKHLPAALLKLIYKNKGAGKIALITDGLAFAASELTEGEVYTQSNGVSCVYEDGVMKLTDRQAFAGSVATMDLLVRNMIDMAGVSLSDAVRMATRVPAQMIGLPDKGELIEGTDADVVIFDDKINVETTISEGRIIYTEKERGV